MIRRTLIAVVAAVMLATVPAFAEPAIVKVIGLHITEPRGDGPPPMTIQKSLTITMDGEESTAPVKAAIEVEGAGNRCLLAYRNECLIKGTYLEIR